MNQRLKIFLAAFLISLPFWWWVNETGKNLEDFVYTAQLTQINVPTIGATAIEAPKELKIAPLLSQETQVEALNLNAEAGMTLFLDNQGKATILFAKNPQTSRPIASLSKLMTALVVLENYDLLQEVVIPPTAVSEENKPDNFKAGETFSVKDLLYSLLIESNNEAATALAEVKGTKNFVLLMNQTASRLNLQNTHFVNVSGLDPEENKEPNYSSAEDLARLTASLLEKPLVWEILSLPRFDLYTPRGILHHQMVNTNEFLEKRPVKWRPQIIGGKTGWTAKAKGCLILVLKAPDQNGYLINIILGADDRFAEMEKMVDWVISKLAPVPVGTG